MSTWATTGLDSIVIEDTSNEKDGFSALATNFADGTTKEIILIAKGKTIKAENNWFGSVKNIKSPSDNLKPLINLNFG